MFQDRLSADSKVRGNPPTVSYDDNQTYDGNCLHGQAAVSPNCQEKIFDLEKENAKLLQMFQETECQLQSIRSEMSHFREGFQVEISEWSQKVSSLQDSLEDG